MLSVIIPSYNEEAMIPITVRTISGILSQADIPYELLFVDDGSKDTTWERICDAVNTEPHVVGVHFSRNFGKEAAMFAGLKCADGDCAVILDCDLQHPPEKIVEMYRLWQDGYEVIEGVKEDRGKESALHRFAANSFYKIISSAAHQDMKSASDFKLLDRKVIDTLNQMPEQRAFFRALSFWAGYKRTSVSYEVRERTAGESKWSTRSLISYAISNITSFSAAPLHIVFGLGIVSLIVTLIFGVIALVQKFNGTALGGFTTVILLLLFFSSMIMITLGIIGYYLARIYDEVKGRPRFIISEIRGREGESN